MTVVGHSAREEPEPWPARGTGRDLRPVLLFALINVPSLLLLTWLALDCCLGPPADGWARLDRLVRLAGLAGALACNGLVYRCITRSADRLGRALRWCSDQEERLRVVLETAADAIFTLDETGRIVSCNPAGARLFGYRTDELIGQPLSLLLPSALGTLSEEVGTGEQRVLGTARALEANHHDGSRFPVSLGISKTRGVGRPLFIAVVSDQSEIHQARLAAQTARHAWSSCLVRMSHEVRTPLGGILGMAELLRHELPHPNQEQQNCLDTIQHSAEAVLAVFAQMIDFAQLEAGDMVLSRRALSLRELVRQTVGPLASLARGKGLRLAVDIAADVPDRWRGDPERLGQVLACLVGNAVKFTTRGEVVLRVERGLAADEPSGACPLCFSVRDTGLGIPCDKLAGIFEPFEQVDTSSTRKQGGVGLGLSLAARLAGLMGGRIEVESRPRRGSTFRFHVGLQPEGERLPAESAAVLVVLACEEERQTAQAHLRGWGFRAVGASTGRAALAELMRAGVEGNPFALVLIAEHLPDLSAREVLRRLGGRLDVSPQAILLGHSEKDLPAPAGFCAVLSRPAVPNELRRAVRQALARCDSWSISEPA